MKILAIETSCDETAISIVSTDDKSKNHQFIVLGNAVYSQTKIHEKWGGVVPNLAKRAHAKKLVPLTKKALIEANMIKDVAIPLSTIQINNIKELLTREKDLIEPLIDFLENTSIPDIDAIAVTSGPGLEPALWVGINFAKALSTIWNKPIVPVNHMEGHIYSVLLQNDENKYVTRDIEYPAIALLISGGHTELILIDSPLQYKMLGSTRDDAVGEAFDKVARYLGLSYPGGPALSKLARDAKGVHEVTLPRPMINSPDFDFSFSGLKTAVINHLQNISNFTNDIKSDIAKEFEEAVAEVLYTKTKKVLDNFEASTLVIGGGVAANVIIRQKINSLSNSFPSLKILIPLVELSTDNAIMIAVVGLKKLSSKSFIPPNIDSIEADGNLVLSND